MKKLSILLLPLLLSIGCSKTPTPYTALNQFGSDVNVYDGIFIAKDTRQYITITKNPKTKFINLTLANTNEVLFSADTFYYDELNSKWFIYQESNINYTYDVIWMQDSFMIRDANNTKLPTGVKFIRSQYLLQ